LLEQALARARSQPPCSARAATLYCPRRRCQPLATCGGRRPGLAPERFPRDIWPCRRQQTGLYGAEAAGSFGRAGQGAHATVVHGCAMRHTAEAVPPRCPGHHKLAHERTDRYASQRSGRRTGQCSHAQTDAARLDCPRLALGCQATFWPPVGSATRSNSRCALPHPSAPLGAQRIADRSWRSAVVALLPLLLCGLSSLLTSVWNVMPRGSCVKGQALQASVLADSGRRPCAYRGTGGAHACRTRRWRRLADRVVARRPHTPASRNGVLVDWSFTAGLCAARAPGAGACSLP
jgi:hypothetical protein